MTSTSPASSQVRKTIPIFAEPTIEASRHTRLARLGQAMQKQRRLILGLQWLVVLSYLLLVSVPAFLPIPPQEAHLYDNLRLFAQFLFWSIWWPFVMLSMMTVGRVWCGVFCPEGALTEWVSRRGLGRPIPRWMRWSGWPFLAFVCTTVYGQMVSVYEYPQAALLVLGGSTVAAVIVGFVYGRGKRVWCRYLCPANGVFALLSKIAPLHFAVNQAAWKQWPERSGSVDCAPLLDIAHMKSASACHSCGRCADHRGAVELAGRSPQHEILSLGERDVTREQGYTLLFGMLGIATAAFLWSSSRPLAEFKTWAANWLIEHDHVWLLQDNAPWWLLTHYPEASDVFTWLDGLCLLGYIIGGGLLLGGVLWLLLQLARTLAGNAGLSWQRLALGLVPIAGAGIFLGLSMLTVSHLKAEGWVPAWLGQARAVILAGGLGFSAWLGWRLLAGNGLVRRVPAFLTYLLACAVPGTVWYLQFFSAVR